MASAYNERQSSPQVPRLRFDLLAQLSIRPAGSNASTPQAPSQHISADQDAGDALERESTKCAALPSVHAHTTRGDTAVRESERIERSVKHSGAQTARIRLAPPPLTHRQPRPSKPGSSMQSPPPPSQFGRVRSSNQHVRAASLCATDNDESLELMRVLARAKQAKTARCFATLRELQEQCENGSTKAMLHQIYVVLRAAVYASEHSASAALGGADSCFALNANDSDSPGTEYFSLLVDSQKTLRELDRSVSALQSQLAMEQAIEREFQVQLRLLDDALGQIQLAHATSTGQIEAERGAVLQLEHEYSTLLSQERDAKRECEVLKVQVNKQKTQLKDVRAKASYLEYVSRVPMKKHLDEKKLRDQEHALLSAVQQADEDNTALEAELATLDAQVASIEQQFQRDFDRKTQLERALRDADDEHERIEAACRRTRECHTPRPSWDDIIDQTPELSHQKYQWEIADDDAAEDEYPSRPSRLESGVAASALSDESDVSDEDAEEQGNNDNSEQHSSESGRTKKLVKEMLHWIERLQKHCGVNLHLSRIWHDIEEARVELNILHHQLDRAVRKTTHHPSLLSAKAALASKKTKREYVVALGTHEEVPRFLRHQGKVKQRYLKKVELETLIRKVWTEKRKRESRNPHGNIRLDDVLYEKLHRKYGFQPLIAEWGYNILLALSAYIWDAEVEMFLLCLTNAITDLVYLDQEQMLESCQQLLYKLSGSYGNESFVTERRVLLKDALVTLRKFFPLKTSVQLQAIEKAMIRDMHKMKRGGNDSILYIDDILPHNVSYPRGFFVKTVRTQHFKEIQDFYSLITSELEQRDLTGSGRLPLFHIKETIVQIDPLADTNTVLAALVKGMAVKSRTQLNMHDVVDYKAVLKKMNTSCLMKFTLNFDPNAEINWQKQHIPSVSNTTASTSSSSCSGTDV